MEASLLNKANIIKSAKFIPINSGSCHYSLVQVMLIVVCGVTGAIYGFKMYQLWTNRLDFSMIVGAFIVAPVLKIYPDAYIIYGYNNSKTLSVDCADWVTFIMLLVVLTKIVFYVIDLTLIYIMKRESIPTVK